MEKEKYTVTIASPSDFDELVCEVEFEGNIIFVLADEKKTGQPTIVIDHRNSYPYDRERKNYSDKFGIDAEIFISAIKSGLNSLKNYK